MAEKRAAEACLKGRKKALRDLRRTAMDWGLSITSIFVF